MVLPATDGRPPSLAGSVAEAMVQCKMRFGPPD